MSDTIDAKPTNASDMVDVQSSRDNRAIHIDKVGIKDIRHPIQVKDRSGHVQHAVANFNMYVDLPHDFKGTHMSRFVEILNNHDWEITVESFKIMLTEMTNRLDAECGHIEMTFHYFVNKAAPASGVKSLLDYEVTLMGERRTVAHTTSARMSQSPLERSSLYGSKSSSMLLNHRHRANSMAY